MWQPPATSLPLPLTTRGSLPGKPVLRAGQAKMNPPEPCHKLPASARYVAVLQ